MVHLIMLYKVSWIVNSDSSYEKTQLLIEAESDVQVREFLQKANLVILSIEQFSLDKKDFWAIEFRFVAPWNKEVLWVSEMPKLKQAYEFLTIKGRFKITYINSVKNPLSQNEVDLIMSKLEKEYLRKIESEKESKASSEEKIDKNLMRFKEAIWETIKDWNELVSIVDWIVQPSLVRQLKLSLDWLVKLKMWTNREKLVSLFEDVIKLMEMVEIEHLEILKKNEIENIKWEVINDLDIVAEYKKYQNSINLKNVNKVWKATKWWVVVFYQTIWKPWVYLTMLYKETLLRIKENKTIVINLINYLEYFVIFLLLEITLLYMFIWWNIWLYYLWNIWLFWILMFLLRMIKIKNNLILISVLVIFIALFLYLRYFIDLYFWF